MSARSRALPPILSLVSLLPIGGLSAAAALGAERSLAGPQCTSPGGIVLQHGESVGLLYEDPSLGAVVEEAISLWSRCGNYRSDFPVFVAGVPGTRVIWIRRERQSFSKTCGSFAGKRVVLYDVAMSRGGKRMACGSLAQNLAHELGHVLGLEDSPRVRPCESHIMAKLTLENRFRRRVQAPECRAAGARWRTVAEGALPPPLPETPAELSSPAAGQSALRPGIR